jgi:PleD family two-component response regulator
VPENRQNRILVVEDEEDLQLILKLHLERAGYEVIAVSDGCSAVEAARTLSPDLLLLDVMMPRMDGYEVLRRLRASYRTRYIPVILVTAKSMEHDRVHGLREGANDVIAKPYSSSELLQRVQVLLAWTRDVRDINPLTGLPGNASIEREVTRRLERGEGFVFLYADANSFKAFNDFYGYARGDRAICEMADALGRAMETLGREANFLGHVGGDDFVIITSPEVMEEMGEAVIREFEARVPALYDPADRERGCIEVINRRGELERFDLLTVTVVGLCSDQVPIGHYAELADRVAELKRHGKAKGQSVLTTERRRAEELATRMTG